MIRVVLPAHLRTLSGCQGEVQLEVQGAVTVRSVLDALEARFPMLRGTIRDHVTQQRRPFLRFFACEEDLSHESLDAVLPEAVSSGAVVDYWGDCGRVGFVLRWFDSAVWLRCCQDQWKTFKSEDGTGRWFRR